MSVASIVELIGSSSKSWEDAAQVAVNDAIKTIRGIRGIEVTDMTAKIDSTTGKIREYRVCVKLAFGVEVGDSGGFSSDHNGNSRTGLPKCVILCFDSNIKIK